MNYYDPIACAEETAEITKNVQRMVAEQQETPTPRTEELFAEITRLKDANAEKLGLLTVARRELSAAKAEAERLLKAYELKVADFAAETLRASEFHALLSEVAASLCDTHGNLPKSKQCRYCDLLGRVRAALAATRKDSSNG